MADVKADIDELSSLLEQAKRPAVCELLSTEIKRLQRVHAAVLPTENGDAAPSSASSAGESNSTPAVEATTIVQARPATQARAYRSPIKSYGWDQSKTAVKIYVSLDGVGALPSEHINVQFGARSFLLEVDNLGGRSYSLEIRQLCEEINPEKSSFKVRRKDIHLTLCKTKDQNWSHLTLSEKKQADAKKPNFDPPSKDEDPGAGIMNMLKKMYDDGDDEMKKTLRKAWCESQDKQRLGKTDSMMDF